MPWSSVALPSLALGLLKQCVRRAGCEPTLYYFNLDFAKQIGLETYEAISENGFDCAEWFFSPQLFGRSGAREMQNDWDDLRANPAAESLTSRLIEMAGGSAETCRDIAGRRVPEFIGRCTSTVDWTAFDVVGFTTTFAQSASSLLLARRIKEISPRTSLILGGANVQSEMGFEMLKGCEFIDHVVHGEAENSLPELLSNIAAASQKPVAGVSSRYGATVIRGDVEAPAPVDLNQSPIPDYGDYMRSLERTGLRNRVRISLYFESSRGCWWGQKHHCTFCGLNGQSMTYRRKEASRVYSEIMELAYTYRCLNLVAADNILAHEYLHDLLPALAAEDMDLTLFYETKANLRKDQVRLLRDAGVDRIQPGIESFNTRLLKLMNKGITGIQNIQLLKWCSEFAIHPNWNILFGFPGETREDYSGLPELMMSLSHLDPPSDVYRVLFERFSPYHFDRDRYGLTISPSPGYEFVFPKQRFDLNRLAYYFAGEWRGQDGDPEIYISETRAAVSQWKNLRKNNETYCWYEKGPRHLMIHDRRPAATGAQPRARRIYLDEEKSAIYLSCDAQRSFAAIAGAAKERFPHLTAAAVRTTLDYFVRQRLMYQEDDKFLALAVRKPQSTRKEARGQMNLQPRSEAEAGAGVLQASG